MTRIRCLLALLTVFTLVIMTAAASVRAQNDGSNETTQIETTRTTRAQTEPTAEPDSSETDSSNTDISSDNADTPSKKAAQIDITGVEQTIAQGLAAFDAFPDGMWRITELEPKSADEAPSVTPDYFGFFYQMDGASIIRNDNTGKRARLEPGEAYYFSAGDAYTRYREKSASRAWLIEIVPTDASPDDAAGTVIYSSDPIANFPDDIRDFELLAGNLLNGDTGTVAEYDTDALLIVTVGSVEVTDDGGTSTMEAPAALPISTAVTLENKSGSPANYMVAKVGPSVGDIVPASADEAPADADATAAADETTGQPGEDVDPMLDTDGDSLIDTDEAVYGTDPTVADTDGDGYSDYDEVVIYETNPLDPGEWP